MLLLFVEKVIFIKILTEVENHHFLHVEKTSRRKKIYIFIIIFSIFRYIVIVPIIQVTVRFFFFYKYVNEQL